MLQPLGGGHLWKEVMLLGPCLEGGVGPGPPLLPPLTLLLATTVEQFPPQQATSCQVLCHHSPQQHAGIIVDFELGVKIKPSCFQFDYGQAFCFIDGTITNTETMTHDLMPWVQEVLGPCYPYGPST